MRFPGSANRGLPKKPRRETGLHRLCLKRELMPSAHFIDVQHVTALRQALADVSSALENLDIDGCDMDDVQELVAKSCEELERNQPNAATLATYLNSVARSLRSQPNVRTVVLELDAAMRDAKVPTNWEH
jgi:hypothetical protein